MPKQKLTEDQKDLAVANHLAVKHTKMTQEDLGFLLDVSARTIYRALEERGYITPKNKKPATQVLVMTGLPAATPLDPHAELRKTYRPEQRWECKAKSEGWEAALSLYNLEPSWFPQVSYRITPEVVCVPAYVQTFVNSATLHELRTMMQTRTQARIAARQQTATA